MKAKKKPRSSSKKSPSNAGSAQREATFLNTAKSSKGKEKVVDNPTPCSGKILGFITRLGSAIEEVASSSKPFCGICMDRKAHSEMFKSGCPHSYCRDCIGGHVAAKILDNVIEVTCPDIGCSVSVEPQHCGSFVPPQVIDRWEAALCEAMLGAEKMSCPFGDCSAVLYVEDGERGVTSAECPHCHRLFCAQCRVPWHAGELCKTEAVDPDDQFIELAKTNKWQKCPYCNFYVQRTAGCESINCRCGHQFCYNCGQLWKYGHICAEKEKEMEMERESGKRRRDLIRAAEKKRLARLKRDAQCSYNWDNCHFCVFLLLWFSVIAMLLHMCIISFRKLSE